jgi:hypothetical protein
MFVGRDSHAFESTAGLRAERLRELSGAIGPKHARHGAEAIIGHHVEGSIAVVLNGGKALYWLLVQERHRLAIDWFRSQLLTGSWTWGKSRGRENGATFQLVSSAHGDHAKNRDEQT